MSRFSSFGRSSNAAKVEGAVIVSVGASEVEPSLRRDGQTPQVDIGADLTLLREFEHVLDVLPEDGDNDGAKSPQNTAEILSYCRAEGDASGERGTLSDHR
jgi:hypothetical protein